MNYQWMKLVDRDVSFVDYYSQNLDTSKEIILDITRIPKHIGFEILQSIDTTFVAETVTFDKLHKLMDYDKVICKPSLGARSIGLIIGELGLIYEYVNTGDLNDLTVESLNDYFPDEIELINVKGYEDFVVDSLKSHRYIAQPLYNVIEEFRCYIAPYNHENHLFPYIVQRPSTYYITRKLKDKKFSVKHISTLPYFVEEVLEPITKLITRFAKRAGKQWPVISVDIITTNDHGVRLIDYGIEFAIPYICRYKNTLNEFIEWLNQSVDKTIKHFNWG